MFAFAPVSAFTGAGMRSTKSNVCARPARSNVSMMSDVHDGPGKGFGGGEATRNPDATEIASDKDKEKAIHPAETFADYQARVAREKAEK